MVAYGITPEFVWQALDFTVRHPQALLDFFIPGASLLLLG